jgi:exonuclease SbcC
VTDVPLRRISISDFRRLEGNRILPLDASIVLLHGPNGTGKTSVLSALELALTGEIRGMRRHDPRYTAHLPYHGQEFATLRVEVCERLARHREPERMTVGGNRIEGGPALEPEAAQFYAERCYLDQVSLGQLLDLYQYREGKNESALARFVNELLGLEQLDALRFGLADANDFRRLKKLSEPLADAETEARQAGTDLSQATKELKSTRDDLTRIREGLVEAMGALGYSVSNSDGPGLVRNVANLLRASQPTDDHSAALDLRRTLSALGGRIEGLSARPSVKRLDEAKAATVTASAELGRWRENHEPAIEAWRADAANLEVPLSGDGVVAIRDALQRIDRRIGRQNGLVVEMTRVEAQLAERRTTLAELQAQLADAQERAGSMVEGLAALREHSSNNVCPVCDRAFGEVSSTHLTAHIDLKIAELTTQGAQLRDFRQQRDTVAAELQRDEQLLEQIREQLLTAAQIEAVTSRRAALASLQMRLHELQPAIDTGVELQSRVRHAEAELEELEGVAREARVVRSKLEKIAEDLDTPAPDPDRPLQDAWRRLADIADERVARAEVLQAAYTAASEHLGQMLRCSERVEELKDTVAQAAERQSIWAARVKEAKRRQGIARAVHDAASQARATIVQRVFTESLNEVWRSVFSRLAPREPFVPAFGIPTASKTALELTLETVHTSGETGGSPQMMLSAGNLNTAALSLFIALHLAVEPLVPCLVFDDPVQSMDEVHIAQFAGLMRVLSKHHKRQVIIAVHERELFQYLALELSPAFEGDELITIELGARSEADDRGINRRTWAPDPAIAV